MQTFLIIWAGQLVSSIGSQMTLFALTIWAWDQTGSATALALIGFFALLSSILSTPVIGQWVDTYNRKWLMLISDSAIALAVLLVLILTLTDQLQIWHLYAIAFYIGCFSQLQTLTYQASLSLLVPEQHHTRAASMGMMIFYSAQILSPAFAGVFYPTIRLSGIILIDLSTFAIALLTLLFIQIPSPSQSPIPNPQSKILPTHSLTTGIRYILTRPSLRTFLLITSAFWFFHELADTLVSPLILARTNGDTTILGSVLSSVGLGGVIGAISLTIWGGPKRRIRGLALGMIGVGVSRMVFGLGRSPWMWLPTQFLASLQFPLFGSSEHAIWFARVAQHLQGRVFAVQMLTQQVAIALAMLMAGPLADRIFEPALSPDHPVSAMLGAIFGVVAGAGIGALITLCSGGMVMMGIGALSLRIVRKIDSEVTGFSSNR
ncbi:MAG: MFS transporter [Elainellaceae cyanobacterium]